MHRDADLDMSMTYHKISLDDNVSSAWL